MDRRGCAAFFFCRRLITTVCAIMIILAQFKNCHDAEAVPLLQALEVVKHVVDSVVGSVLLGLPLGCEFYFPDRAGRRVISRSPSPSLCHPRA